MNGIIQKLAGKADISINIDDIIAVRLGQNGDTTLKYPYISGENIADNYKILCIGGNPSSPVSSNYIERPIWYSIFTGKVIYSTKQIEEINQTSFVDDAIKAYKPIWNILTDYNSGIQSLQLNTTYHSWWGFITVFLKS